MYVLVFKWHPFQQVSFFPAPILQIKTMPSPVVTCWNGSLNVYVCVDCLRTFTCAQLAACSVNTPTKTTGIGAGKAADLTYWEGAARLIASVSTSSKIVVEKSTVPVKTAEAIGKVSENAFDSDCLHIKCWLRCSSSRLLRDIAHSAL